MIQLNLRDESPRGLSFSYPNLSGWILLVGAVGGLWFLFALGTVEGKALWIGSAILGLVGLAGLYGALRRFDLTLDFAARRYRGRRGWGPSSELFEGSFDGIREVRLDLRWVRSSRKHSQQEKAQWRVTLVIAGWEEPIGLLATHNEERAFQRFEGLAKALRVDAVDRTGDEEKRRRWQDLDVSVAQAPVEAGDAVELTLPPAGSGVDISQGVRGQVILLPKLGFSAGGWLGVLFTGTFAVLGTASLLAVLKVIPWEIQVNSVREGMLVSIVFILVGLGLTLALIAGSQVQERIEDQGEALAISSQLWGRQLDPKRLAKAEVEAIELRGGTSRRNDGYVQVGNRTFGRKPKKGSEGEELFIRTDSQVVRLGGDLAPEVRQWLRLALTSLVRR